MAIYHLSVKTMSRSKGQSAVASAAYRAAVSLVDERTGEIHDYTRKRGVLHREIVVPADTPIPTRQDLWSTAEKTEKRINSTVAREIEIALPVELDARTHLELVRQLARELADAHQVAVDACVHASEMNPHAHLLMTTRVWTAAGDLAGKTREWDDRKAGSETVTKWRERWAELANEALSRAGQTERIDHRSHEARGIAAAPGRHLGPTAAAMERRGVRTDRGGDLNRPGQGQVARAGDPIAELVEISRRPHPFAAEIGAAIDPVVNARKRLDKAQSRLWQADTCVEGLEERKTAFAAQKTAYRILHRSEGAEIAAEMDAAAESLRRAEAGLRRAERELKQRVAEQERVMTEIKSRPESREHDELVRDANAIIAELRGLHEHEHEQAEKREVATSLPDAQEQITEQEPDDSGPEMGM